ncbi:armadillo repeat-containing protein 8-like isoform X2 [Onthophagus taurus]|uniref:armadillo repeat-containing protein 8-like isoform X2 n=1 Tax=Onthophagus taurus TaxID=166361 RepID=UPI000C20E21B|nr:armadillo repeat-containing protein 8-like isoform X2 [Onthophagus taurus]
MTNLYPFAAFMNVESSRAYVDDLYSMDSDKCLASLICIKNSVIGSNKQKESVIEQGIVTRLIQLAQDTDMKVEIRYEALIILGSLAKGTPSQVEVLLKFGTGPILLGILEESHNRLIDPSLRLLRTLSQYGDPSFSSNYSTKQLEKLLSYMNEDSSLLRQSCVATILSTACRCMMEQNSLCSVGAPQILASVLAIPNTEIRVAVLKCLSAMCFENRTVASEVAGATSRYGSVQVLNLLTSLVSRDKPVEMQLEAAKCLTNIYRAGAIQSSDQIITFRTLPCLVRLCLPDQKEDLRSSAANILAYLTEVDSNLQQIAAISNQLVATLADLLNCKSSAARTAAFSAFASLGANNEEIRKRIIETQRLMERVVDGLADQDGDVRLAAVRCLHSLSRSVHQLRTTFQDHSVWRPLMSLLTGSASTELLSAASSALCNLLLEFSPAKEPMLQQGVIQFLVELTKKPEPVLRLNAVWALMNMTFQAEQRIKSAILTTLNTDQIFRLLADSDVQVLMKTLGLLRNLVSPRAHTDSMMALHGTQVMQAVVLVLEGAHSPEVKEQALCILGNIADGERAKDHIMANEDVLKKLMAYMTHSDSSLQTAAIFCIQNLVRRGEPGYAERQARLRDMGVHNILHQLVTTVSDSVLHTKVKAALTDFSDL